MEEKELKTPKHCLSCKYHETYYTKCGLTFYREKRGYCSQQQKLTENHDTCEEWQKKNGSFKRNMRQNATSKVVTKMAKDIFGNRPDFVRRQNRRTGRKRINGILRKVIEKMFEKGEKGLKI